MNAAPPVPIADPATPAARAEAAARDRGAMLDRLIWAALAVGAALRLWHYLAARSLWIDEAMVALNLRHLSARELLGKLYYDQLAPAAWMQLEKLLEGLVGSPEFELRAPALAASIGALFLFRSLALRVLNRHGALAAMILFAVSPQLVRYAAEVKPYAFDVLFSVAILLAGVELLARRELSVRRLAGFAALGVGAVLFSFSAVFVLAGAGLVVALRRLVWKRWTEVAALVLIGILWLGLFAALYVGVYQPQFAETSLTTGSSHTFFVSTSYAPFPPTSAGEVVWYVSWAGRGMDFLFGRDSRLAMALVVGLGALALARYSPWTAALVLAALPIALLASSVHAYPLYKRLILFLAPSLLLLAGVGVQAISGRTRPRLLAWLALMALTAAGGMVTLGREMRMQPAFARQQVRPVLEVLERERRPGETIYVGRRAIAPFLLYRNDYGMARAPWTPGRSLSTHWLCVLGDMPARPAGRAWMLIYEVQHPVVGQEISAILAARGSSGELRPVARAPGAYLFALDLRAPLAGEGRSALPGWNDTCARRQMNTPNPPPALQARTG